MRIEVLLSLWETAHGSVHGSLYGNRRWAHEFRTRPETERIIEFHDEDIERCVSQERRLVKILELLEAIGKRPPEYQDLVARNPPNTDRRLREVNPEVAHGRSMRDTLRAHDEDALYQLWDDIHGDSDGPGGNGEVAEILLFPWAAIAEVMSSEPDLSKILSELKENWAVVPPRVAQSNLPYR